MQTISAILFIIGSCLLVFFLFLIFTNLSLLTLVLAMVPVVIFGFYLNHDVRKMV
jgi:hypothetical protein